MKEMYYFGGTKISLELFQSIAFRLDSRVNEWALSLEDNDSPTCEICGRDLPAWRDGRATWGGKNYCNRWEGDCFWQYCQTDPLPFIGR